MKLHRNRKKRSNVKRFISLALVCCMTLTMGSSYVNAGEANPPVAEAEAAGQSLGGVEAVPLETQGAEGQEAGNMEGTPADAGQGSVQAPEKAGAGQQQTPTGEEPETPDVPETVEVPEVTGTPEVSEPTQTPEVTGTPGVPEPTETPEATGTPDKSEPTETPEATGTPDVPEPTETPEATDTPSVPEPTETPEVPGTPEVSEPTQTPEVTGTPEPTETPDATQAPVQEDYSGNMSIYELFMQPMDTVGATMSLERGVSENPISENDWSFDTYYVNEADRYNVTKTDDFSLKYQMEFHASTDFPARSIKIKIDGALLTYRDETKKASPSDIGVPVALWKDGVMVENPSRSTSFNYYYEGEDGRTSGSYSAETPTLVFYNYKPIPSGTNAAWQVLYSNLKIMDIKDDTAWSRKPEVYINDKSTKEMNAFTGRVNSSVSLTSVVKTPYYESGKKYTPGLYTLNQLQNYVSTPIGSPYVIDKDTNPKLNTQDYRYVVWDVKITGKATQPWELYIEDAPTAVLTEGGTARGTIVGYKDNSDVNTNYNFGIKDIQPTEAKISDSDMTDNPARKKSWGHRFWVVTAYPAGEVQPGDEVKNDITVTLHPKDGKDADEVVSATPASWSYKDYDWHYEGDVISTNKWNNWNSRNDTTEYTGWLEAYRRAKTKTSSEDYGEIPFTVTGHMKGYDVTHQVKGAQLGEYIPGTSYSLTTVDDFLYIKKVGGEPTLLGKDDYYFSSVTINQKDHGYDIYEDRLTASERKKLVDANILSGEFGKVDIYAMYAKDAAGNLVSTEKWESVGAVSMDGSGNADYAFTPEQIARQPYRVKVVHESIDYSTECTIKVAVRLKADSHQMAAICNEYNAGIIYGGGSKYELENLSGVMGQITKDGGTTAIYASESGDDGTTDPDFKVDSATSYNYTDRQDLAEKTRGLYEGLLVRQNATRTVTWLETNAQASKKYSAKNDAVNNRVLVDYYLTAFDGYKIYDRSCLDYMSKSDEVLISPGRKHVVFYDLLPYGMQFDASTPVTAGRIKELDKNESYKESPRSWDSTQVSVTVDPGKDIRTNYKGTGRTLVAFHISYSGADPTVYTNGKWVEAWGVSFRAYYDWKNMDSVNKDANSNLAAFMPDFGEGYIDDINRNNPQLYGLATQVYADDGEIAETEKEMYKDLLVGDGKLEHKGNIDGISAYDKEGENWNRNVLYANETVNDNVATSSESTIEKLVRADSDTYGAFSESAMVGPGGRYTYEIRVSAKNSNIKGIAVFDRLENVSQKPSQWQGNLCDIDLSALEKQQIGAKVYCSDSRDAAIPDEDGDPQAILNGNGWYEICKDSENPEKGWCKEAVRDGATELVPIDISSVKAIAVLFDSDYVLKEGHTVSFQIKMQAPGGEDIIGKYAYNNAWFSSCAMDQAGSVGSSKTVPGNPASVGVNKVETLEIVKRTSGVVPTALLDNEFSFQVFEKDADGKNVKKPFLAYDLYKQDKSGNWQIQSSQPHATDENGYLYLKADEKAAFTVVDASRILVEETANVFWDANPATGAEAQAKEERYKETATTDTATGEENVTRIKDANGDIHVRTWTNTFRPVVYVQKELAAVPQGADTADAQFTLKLWVKKNGEYEPAANAAFWYVDSVLTDGGIPGRLNEDGQPWTEANGQADAKQTDADGTFTIKPGQIIALFPGLAGTEYKLTEENLDANGYSDNGDGNWYCIRPEMTGTVVSEGSSRTFTNYYRWKDLDITKEITHQDASDCTQPFTFQITELKLGRDGKPEKDPQGNDIVVKKQKTDADGNLVEVVSTQGLAWELLNPPAADAPVPSSGTLDDEGRFTCAFAGMTVRVKGLEAGKYYQVKEILPDGDEAATFLYQPVNDTEEFKMPANGTKKDLTFVNDYLKRPLTVKKTVTGMDNGTTENPAFVFEAKVNGQPIPEGTAYTVMKQGVEVRSGVMGGEGNSFVDETTDSEGNIVPAKFAEGKFTLHDGETITFEEAGILGQTFEVTEIDKKGYNQLYPADEGAAQGTLTGEGGEASFVNGTPGAIYISKEYVAATSDKTAEKVVNGWKNKIAELHFGGTFTDVYSDECAAEFILEVTDTSGTYIWPKEGRGGIYVSGINQLNGEMGSFWWEIGKSIKLPPWVILSIPVGENGIPENASYTLREVESSQKRIIVADLKGGNLPLLPLGAFEEEGASGTQPAAYALAGPDQASATDAESQIGDKDDSNIGDVDMDSTRPKPTYVQVTQSYPANFGSISGTVQDTPTATIVNELKSLDGFNGSRIGKRMTAASSEVPTGQKLVWRVEKYDSTTETWSPAENIKYAVFKNDGSPISNEVKATGSDGKIVLEKPEGGLPQVWFVEDAVYINLYAENMISNIWKWCSEKKVPMLRIVEVPEESGKEWGLLAGYGLNEDSPDWRIQEWYYYHDSDFFNGVAYFYNSNSKSSIEIEKYTEKQSYQEFTMILEQVVGTSEYGTQVGHISSANYDKLVSEPRGGIEYTIHNTDGTDVVGPTKGVTGPGGEIKLRAGQYVILDVPDGTAWIVSEDTYATQNYDLVNLEPEAKAPGGKLTKLTDNLMLVNLPAPIEYKLIYDGNGEGDLVTNLPTPTMSVAGGNTQQVNLRVSNKVPVREHYQFTGWSYYVNANGLRDEVICHGGDMIQMNPDMTTITLRAQWERTYTLTYHPGEGVSPEEVAGMPDTVTQTSNQFTIPKTPPTRNGYIFVGWRDGEATQQPGYMISVGDGETRTLYALWEKTLPCYIIQRFTGNGITLDDIPENHYIAVTLQCTLTDGREIKYDMILNRENVVSETEVTKGVEVKWIIPKVRGEVCVYTLRECNYNISGYELQDLSVDIGAADKSQMKISIQLNEMASGATRTITNSYKSVSE